MATSDTREVVALALRLLRSMPRPGPVKKAGVDAFGLVPEGVVQGNMFDVVDREENARLQGALDGLEKRWGKDAVKLAVQGTRPGWRMRREHLSRRYTTVWSEILEIDMDKPVPEARGPAVHGGAPKRHARHPDEEIRL